MQEIRIDDGTLKGVNEEFAKAYSKWNKEQQAQKEDLMRQESMVESCRKQSKTYNMMTTQMLPIDCYHHFSHSKSSFKV